MPIKKCSIYYLLFNFCQKVDKSVKKTYNFSMIKRYVDYISKNGFYYHHTVNTNPDEYTSRLESHNKIEILYLISGIMDYHINGSTFHIRPGDIIIVNAQELHNLHIGKGAPYERIVLQISSELIPTSKNLDLSYPFLNAHLYAHIIPKETVSKTNLVRLFKSIFPIIKKSDKYTDIKVIARIIDIIAEINQAVETLTTEDYHLIPQPESTNKLLLAIIKYINENLNKNYTVQEIADVFHISESYLHRFFKMHMNITLYKYILNQKLQYALSLLNQGYTPQYVSDYLGYDYYTTFYTQFKRKFKKSPKATTIKV